MNKFLKLFLAVIPLVIFLGLMIFFSQGLKQDLRKIPSPLINKPIPKFSLPLVSDANNKLTDQTLSSQVSLLNVWATWCTSCAEEHPVLVDIANTHQVAIYGLDYKDKRSAAKKWLKTFGNPYQQVGFDGKGNVAIDWGVYGVPETFLIDKKGIIRYKHIGPVTQAVWQKEILPLVNKLK